MKKNCKVEYKEVPNNSLETTRNFLIANQVIDRFNSIINLNNFRLAVTELTENARKLGYFPNRIIREEQNGRKAVFDIPSFKKIDGIKAQQEKIANRQPTLFQLPENQVNYVLKSANALQSDKVRNPKNNLQGFYNDLQKQGVTNQQIEIIKSLNPEGKTKEELLTELLANYSYTVEINTAKENAKTFNKIQGYDAENVDVNSLRIEESDWGGSYIIVDKNGKHLTPLEYTKEEAEEILAGIGNVNTQYYSNLTVPGGTAYIESEIAIPDIFFTDNEVESLINTKIEELKKSGDLEIEC